MNIQDYLVVALMIGYIMVLIYIKFHPTNKSSSPGILERAKADNRYSGSDGRNRRGS